MSDIIRTKSIGKGIAKAGAVLLNQTSDTALLFQPQIHEGGVRGTLVRFKKERGKDWEKIDEMDFRKLNLYDGVQIELGTQSIKLLLGAIQSHNAVSKMGISYGQEEFIAGKKDEVMVITDQNLKGVIIEILNKGFSKSFWEEFSKLSPNDATAFSRLQMQRERDKALKTFRDNIELQSVESFWQDYFEHNKWIFGYGLNYRILRQEQTQPNYGGAKVDGSGGQKGDFLAATEGDISFTILVEIKTPNTPLLAGKTPQRNGAWSLSKELVDSITQLQANRQTWEQKGSADDKNRDRLEGKNTYTICPKGILVIGRLKDLSDRDKRGTFERFRQSIHGIEILTFDELLKRAEYIVEESIY